MLDNNNKEIDNIVEFIGDFHTGKRTIIFDQYDDFIEMHSRKKLVGITGTVAGITTNDYGSSKTVFESKAVTNIILSDGSIYRVNKDGSCVKYDNEDEAKRIFK